MEDRVASLEAAVHERTLQNDLLINDLSQKAVLHQSVSKELESTRAHLADRIRVAAHLQHQLRERSNGKMQGQADFDQNWQELLLDQKRGKAAVGRVKSLMLKTDQRNQSGSGGVEGQKSRHACVGTKMSRHASRDGSGTGLRSDGSVALTKEMFNMRPRLDSKRPMSAPSTGRRAPHERQLTKEHGKMLKMVRTKPHGNFSSSQKATAEEALLEAAIENDSDAVLLMLSLVRDERRNKSLASHALAIAAKNGSEAVCRGLMDACGALDTDSAIFRAAQSGHIKTSIGSHMSKTNIGRRRKAVATFASCPVMTAKLFWLQSPSVKKLGLPAAPSAPGVPADLFANHDNMQDRLRLLAPPRTVEVQLPNRSRILILRARGPKNPSNSLSIRFIA